MHKPNKYSFVIKGIICLLLLYCAAGDAVAQMRYNYWEAGFTQEYCLKTFTYNRLINSEYEPIAYEQFLNDHSKRRHIKDIIYLEVDKYDDALFAIQQTYDTGAYILLNTSFAMPQKRGQDTLWQHYNKYTYSPDRLRIDVVKGKDKDTATTHKLFVFNAHHLIDTVIEYSVENTAIISKLYYSYDSINRLTAIFLNDSAGTRKVSNLLYYPWTNKFDFFGRIQEVPFGDDSDVLSPKAFRNDSVGWSFLSVFDSSNSGENPNYNFVLYNDHVVYRYGYCESVRQKAGRTASPIISEANFYRWNKKGNTDYHFSYFYRRDGAYMNDGRIERHKRNRWGKWHGKYRSNYIKVTQNEGGLWFRKMITHY